jgi:hypothetical protein
VVVTLRYVAEDGGPAGFYARLGFTPTGDLDDSGEVIVRLPLAPAGDDGPMHRDVSEAGPC